MSIPIQAEVQVNVYRIISDAVDVAVRRGCHRAHKHLSPDEIPSEGLLAGHITNEVMNALCDVLVFPE